MLRACHERIECVASAASMSYCAASISLAPRYVILRGEHVSSAMSVSRAPRTCQVRHRHLTLRFGDAFPKSLHHTLPRLSHDNGNVHRAAAKDLQAEKAARPASPCATYCYHAITIVFEPNQTARQHNLRVCSV